MVINLNIKWCAWCGDWYISSRNENAEKCFKYFCFWCEDWYLSSGCDVCPACKNGRLPYRGETLWHKIIRNVRNWFRRNKDNG